MAWGRSSPRARFLREARTAATLRHPGVVQVYDVDPDARFLVMELVDGESLAVRIRRSPLTAAEARRLGAALLDTLAVAHAAGVVHRDVKPANILLEPDGTPRLADFAIATIEGDPELTSANQRLGTPAYTAPEQLRGLRVDGRADQFAVAATLFKAVVGRGPFADTDSAAAGPRAALKSATADAGLAAAIERALADRPEDRFPDAAAFAAALRAGDTTSHGSEEAGAPTLETPLASLPEIEAPESAPNVPSPRRLHPWVVLGCLAALALGLGFGARFNDAPSPPPEPIAAPTPPKRPASPLERARAARDAGDPSVATALLESPLPDVRAVAMALVAEARGDLEGAARHWTEPIDGASSTRVLSLVAFQRARVAAALGRSETVIADCEQVIRPGQFEWTWGELVGPCLVMTAQAQLALSRPEQARDTLRRLTGLRRAAPSQDPLLREAAALQAKLP